MLPALQKFGNAGQQAFLPPIQAALKGILPLLKSLQPSFASFSGLLGKAFGGLVPIIGSLAKPMLDFASASLQGLKPLGPVLQLFATQLGGVLEQMVKSGVAQQAMTSLVQIIGALLPILPPLVKLGGEVLAILGPSLATVVQQLVLAFVQLFPSILQLTPSIAQLLVALAPLLPTLTQLVIQLMPSLISVIQATIPAIPPLITLIQAISLGLSTVIGWIVSVYTGMARFQLSVHNALAPTGSFATTLRNTFGPAFSAVGGFITGAATKVGSFLTSLTGFRTKVATLSSGLFDGLSNAFRTAINFIINGWNRLQFSVPSINIGGAKFGGGTIGVPHITPLATGGVVKARPGGTLIQAAEAGEDEVVSPLSKVPSLLGGGAASSEVLDALNDIRQLLREFLERPAQVRLDNRLVGAVDGAFGRGGF
jgi:phage-related protein